MSNSNRAELRTSLGLDEQTFSQIIDTYNAGAILVGDDFANVVPDTLNKYEEEILRLREANERLRTKNRNYRTGMKQLQRAHEASLHREAAIQATADQHRTTAIALAEGNGGCYVGYNDGEQVPYAPVRFNNEPDRVFANGITLMEADRPE